MNEIKMNVSLELDENCIKKAIEEYVRSKGYSIKDDVALNFKETTKTVGYGMGEMDIRETVLTATVNVD